jgi:hypothetical protein
MTNFLLHDATRTCSQLRDPDNIRLAVKVAER